MKMRRKSQPTETSPAPATTEPKKPAVTGPGPYDASQIPDDLERIDVGAILVAPVEGLELRLQVNEAEEVSSVMLATGEGAMELQAFSAPRSGGLWADVRPQLAGDVERRGGTWEEREGPWGTELLCRLPVQMPDGGEGVQPSRFIGVEGDRWLLRVTLLGRPAFEVEGLDVWEKALALVAVRRGETAMPVGRPLPLTMPEQARRA